MHMYVYIKPLLHTHTHTHKHAHAHTHTQTHTQTHRHTDTHRNTQTHRHTDTYRHMHTTTHPPTRTQTHPHPHTQPHTQPHMRTHTHTHPPTHPPNMHIPEQPDLAGAYTWHRAAEKSPLFAASSRSCHPTAVWSPSTFFLDRNCVSICTYVPETQLNFSRHNRSYMLYIYTHENGTYIYASAAHQRMLAKRPKIRVRRRSGLIQK